LITQITFGEAYRSLSFTPLLPYPCWTQMSPSAPHSQTPSAYISPSMWATKFYTHKAVVILQVMPEYWHSRTAVCWLLVSVGAA
jgi:hypothetical protein